MHRAFPGDNVLAIQSVAGTLDEGGPIDQICDGKIGYSMPPEIEQRPRDARRQVFASASEHPQIHIELSADRRTIRGVGPIPLQDRICRQDIEILETVRVPASSQIYRCYLRCGL